MDGKKFLSASAVNVNWWAVAGVVAGAVVANLLHWGFPAINGMVVAALLYIVGRALNR
jgi:cytosine permease